MKNFQNLIEEVWVKNRKIISVDIVNEKTFQPGLRTRKKKPKVCGKKKVLVKEGLGQRKA